MKKLYLILTFTLLHFIVNGQEKKEEMKIVENLPVFKGCEKKKTKQKREECTNVELYKFIMKNKRYPKGLIGKGFSGTSYVTFTVDTLGNIVDEWVEGKFQGDQGNLFDDEALKVVRQIPRMTPGMSQGRPEAVKYTVPVKFNDN